LSGVSLLPARAIAINFIFGASALIPVP